MNIIMIAYVHHGIQNYGASSSIQHLVHIMEVERKQKRMEVRGVEKCIWLIIHKAHQTIVDSAVMACGTTFGVNRSVSGRAERGRCKLGALLL